MLLTKSPTTVPSGRVLLLPVSEIRPNPAQPRRVFDPQSLQEQADSIAVYGILLPLSVRRTPSGWELIAGERRLRAARIAGLAQVPCIALSADEQASGMLALIENLQRRDLSFLEEAQGIARLMREFHLTQEQAARRLGKSQSAVANKLRLLRLPDETSQLRCEGLIAAGGWTVAKTEQYIDQQLSAPARPARALSPFRLRDARLLINSVRHHLELAADAGIGASTEQTENEQEIVLTIRIPKRRAP